MSKINELIKEMCPNGVEFKKLEDCCNILDNKRKPISKGIRERGEYPYYGANGIQDYISDYIFDGKYVLVGEDGSVQTPNGTPIVNWAIGKIWVNNHAHIIEEIDGVSLRYLYHYLQIVDVKDLIHGNIPKLNQSNFRNIKIAVPPLEVQEEIVKILDKFGELEAELEARKSQYEFWRGKVFNRDKETIVTLETIGDITKLAGFEFSKYVHYSDEGNVIALRGLNVKNGHLVLDDVKYVDNSDFSKLNRSKLYENDILYTYVGTVGQVGLVDKNDKYYLAPNVARIRIFDKKVNPKYVMHFLLTAEFKINQLESLSGTSSMKNITMTNIRKFKIPVPSLQEQERVVNILDKFDALVNDITEGIPAEIELRRQQYEYYRNKLLSFEGFLNE